MYQPSDTQRIAWRGRKNENQSHKFHLVRGTAQPLHPPLWNTKKILSFNITDMIVCSINFCLNKFIK